MDEGPTRTFDFNVDPLQKLPLGQFIDAVTEKCGKNTKPAYDKVLSKKELCFIEDEKQRAEAIIEFHFLRYVESEKSSCACEDEGRGVGEGRSTARPRADE